VGGVNQKIEGFFQVCKEKGLDGSQGVIIPRQNVGQLMLSDEVITAVKERQFNIWAVEHIDQGLEILTGRESGQRNSAGNFPSDSIHDRVDKKLSVWSQKRSPAGQYPRRGGAIYRTRRRG